MANVVKHPALVALREMTLVALRGSHRDYAIDRAVQRDRRDVDLGQRREPRFGFHIAGVVWRRAQAMAVGVDRHVDKIRVVERDRATRVGRLVKGPGRRPQLPEQPAEWDAVGGEPGAAAFGVEVVLIPEAPFLFGIGRLSGVGDVLNEINRSRSRASERARPERRDDASCPRTPVEPSEDCVLEFQRVEQVQGVVRERGLLA